MRELQHHCTQHVGEVPQAPSAGTVSTFHDQRLENTTAERSKLLGAREDPERVPDLPEDPACLQELRGRPSHPSSSSSAERRGVLGAEHCPDPPSVCLGQRAKCLWCGAGVGVGLVVAAASVLRNNFEGSFPFAWPGSSKSSSSLARGELPTIVVPPGRPGICNLSLPPFFPEPIRSWRLPALWRRACEAKNHHGMVPFERNWCWIGIKMKCHANLKAHRSWARLQELAAQEGVAPPAADAAFHPLAEPEVCDRPELGRAQLFAPARAAEARRWLKENVAVYVVNLPADRARWSAIAKRLQSLQIWATRISGVDMRVPGALKEAKRMGWVPRDFNFTHAQTLAYLPEHGMGSILGTLGCASAHFKVQQRLLADGSPLGLVLEDDSWPEDDFIERLWSLVNEELPCDWEILALMSRCPYGRCVSRHLARVQPDGNEPAWRCRHGVNWGMHGILYRTATLQRVQDLWRRTVFNEETPRCLDVDVALASISDRVAFYAVPAVQDPGLLSETNHPSTRWNINQAALTTTTDTTTSFIFVPTVAPGEPWPGAWKFG